MHSVSTSVVEIPLGALTNSRVTCIVRLSGDTVSRVGRTKITRKFVKYLNKCNGVVIDLCTKCKEAKSNI